MPGTEGFTSSTGACLWSLPAAEAAAIQESSFLTPNVFLRAWPRQELSSLSPGWAPAVPGMWSSCLWLLVSGEPQTPSCRAEGQVGSLQVEGTCASEL